MADIRRQSAGNPFTGQAGLPARRSMKTTNTLLSQTGTTIFTLMSALATRHGAINLGQGFPDQDGPADIVQAAADALLNHHNQYAPLTGLAELRQAVATANQRFYGLNINPEYGVVVTSGATEAITACLMALINPGDEVVLIEPLYDTYLPTVLMLGGIPKLVRLNPPDWSLPYNALADAFSARTKLLLLNSPMNPCGKVFSLGELSFIADLLDQYDAYAVCDEVYEHLVFAPAVHIPLMSLPGMFDRTLRIGSAGKTFSLTGWKVGYVSGPNALAELVAKAHQNLTFCTAPHLQRAVALGLGKPDSYFTGLAEGLQAKRDLLAAGLKNLGFGVLPADGSYFLTTDISAFGFTGDDAAFCRDITEHAGVAAIPISAFYAGAPPANFVRFAFCKQETVLQEALSRLARYLPAQKLTAAG
jgi:N-succinyldiaminopimelate aminotransferase